MKILSRIMIPAAILLLNFSAFAQTQSYKGEYEFASDAGIKRFLKAEGSVSFAAKSAKQTESAVNVWEEAGSGSLPDAESFAGAQPFQKIKTVSNDLVKNSRSRVKLIMGNPEEEKTYGKKSSFWTSDILYFAAGVAAATAAYFLISGTSEATSSRKTFGYPPPPSN